MNRNDLKAAAVIVLAVLVVGVMSYAAITVKQNHDGSSKPKTLTTEQKLQRIIDAKKTSAVASARVIICKNAGAQTVQGRTIDPVYACPVLVSMKDGSGGCVGILATDSTPGKLVVVTAPAAIDPRYCQ